MEAWEDRLRNAIQTSVLGFDIAAALEEIASLRRALEAERDHIREIREVVGREED
jgi:hypothetical protein